MATSTFNLKEVFNEYGWNSGFKFEIVWTSNGTARIYINDRKTKYVANGYGYDKESSVIATMINDLIGEQSYDVNVYGNYKGFLSAGTGFDSIKNSFESANPNYSLIKLYSGKSSNVYEIKFK